MMRLKSVWQYISYTLVNKSNLLLMFMFFVSKINCNLVIDLRSGTYNST